MRPFVLLLSIFACGANALSQQTPVSKPLIPLPKNPTNWGSQITMTDNMGRPFRPAYPDVTGSPYFFDAWKEVDAKSPTGEDVQGILRIKLDLHNQQVDCMVSSGDSIIVQDGFLGEFTLMDSMMTGRDYLFRSGYPAMGKNTKNSFYQVLSDGSLQLLKFSKKEIKTNKDELSGEISKEFVQYDDYYIFQNGELVKWKKDKEYILGLMKDQQKRIDEYLGKTSINFKKPESIAQLFDFYNRPARAF